MFGPTRGACPNDEGRGWWRNAPLYQTPVYVLTHHKKELLKMKGDTTFHFVTDEIESALKKAKKAQIGFSVAEKVHTKDAMHVVLNKKTRS